MLNFNFLGFRGLSKTSVENRIHMHHMQDTTSTDAAATIPAIALNHRSLKQLSRETEYVAR